MLAVDNIGRVGLGLSPSEGRLQAQGSSGSGEIGLELRSGNATSSGLSLQIALGFNGEAAMRHAIRTQHSTSTIGNRMDFLVWNPGAGSTATVANLKVLSLEASEAASSGSFHVRPAGDPDVELEVSDGATTGGGTLHRASAGTHSARRLKTDIRYLGEKEEAQAYRDVMVLRPAWFRYKALAPDGSLVGNPGARLWKGLIYEDSPESIRGTGKSIVIDERVANVEMALKEAMRKLERLQARLRELEAAR